MPALRIVISGRVQGVGFRYFARETAEAMGVKGEVRNRHDGNVEAIAEHPDQKVVDAYAEALEAGPGRVASITTEACAESGFLMFEVAATR